MPAWNLAEFQIAHLTTTIVMTQHDFLREIYNDFCIKNDMPKHINGGYLSAGDINYASNKYQLTKHQKDWLQEFLVLWDTRYIPIFLYL